MSQALTRRTLLTTAAVGAAATAFPHRTAAQSSPRVVVVGGGFGGGTCARELKRKGLAVTLVESTAVYTACPFSNAVLAGLRPIETQQFKLDAVEKGGIDIVRQRATRVDPQARRIVLEDGSSLEYDRLVLSPGIDIRFDALPGYDEAAAATLPHAWKAGEQTILLRRQLEAMDDGGTFVMAAPANPFRCPPGPYERASLIAHYFKKYKPRSKLLILDAKDSFSKQRLFQAAWQDLYPNMIEWVPLSSGGKVIEVDATTRALVTDFGRHTGDVVNVIPPQRAGQIAQVAGVADRTGWCPIDPVTFESRLQPNIHVIGDASIAGGMPKSAFSANVQGKVCAVAIASLLRGDAPVEPKLINTCYSLVAPDYGISVAGVYSPRNGVLTDVEGAGGTSPVNAPPSFRAQEAAYAEAWFQTIASEVYG
jgi:NADPH-dependent 2,4-dienoyl-CoA reductase/sulfur reductase-like enzyme